MELGSIYKMGCADNRLKTQIGTVPCNKGMYYFESHQSQLGGGVIGLTGEQLPN